MVMKNKLFIIFALLTYILHYMIFFSLNKLLNVNNIIVKLIGEVIILDVEQIVCL